MTETQPRNAWVRYDTTEDVKKHYLRLLKEYRNLLLECEAHKRDYESLVAHNQMQVEMFMKRIHTLQEDNLAMRGFDT